MNRRIFLKNAVVLAALAVINPLHNQAATILPNFVVSNGTKLCNVNSGVASLIKNAKGFGGATGAGATNSSSYIFAGDSQTFKLDYTAAGAGDNWDLDFDVSGITFQDVHNFGLWIYSPNWNNLQNIQAFISNDAGFANYTLYGLSSANSGVTTFQNSGRYYFHFHKADSSTPAGAPNLNNSLSRIRLRFSVLAAGSYTYYLGSLWKNRYSKPKVIIRHDHLNSVFYAQEYTAFLRPRNIKICAVIQSDQTSPVMASTSDYQSMYADGCDMINHGRTHEDMTTLTNTEILEHMLSGQAFLDSINIGQRCRKYFVPPNNGWNSLVDETAAIAHYTSTCISHANGRMVRIVDGGLEGENNSFRRFGVEASVSTGATSATILAKVDETIRYGGCMALLMHNIQTAGAAGVDWDQTNYRALMTGLARRRDSGLLDIVTQSEYDRVILGNRFTRY